MGTWSRRRVGMQLGAAEADEGGGEVLKRGGRVSGSMRQQFVKRSAREDAYGYPPALECSETGTDTVCGSWGRL